MSQYVTVLKHLATDCKFNVVMCMERLRDRLVSGIRDKRMMSDLLKLELEEPTFDIAVARCIAIEQSYKYVEALQGVKNQTQSICYPSLDHARSLNLREKLSLQRKRVPHPLKSRVIKVATAVWEIMIIKVVHSKRKMSHCNKNSHIARACKSKKRETQAVHPPVNYVDSDDGESNDYLVSLDVYNVSDEDHVIWISSEVQGRVVKMELDTGLGSGSVAGRRAAPYMY